MFRLHLTLDIGRPEPETTEAPAERDTQLDAMVEHTGDTPRVPFGFTVNPSIELDD